MPRSGSRREYDHQNRSNQVNREQKTICHADSPMYYVAYRRTGNSVGGVVEIVVRNVPSGLGAPVFDKLEAELARACLSIPACKGFEVSH